VVFVKGKVEAEQKMEQIGNVTVYNYMQATQLEKTINQSEMVLSRSGYTTVMDLAKLKKKAFFIPTPGQFEQEYLAIQLAEDGLVPTATQEEFTIKNLDSIDEYKGLPEINTEVNWRELFSLFKGK
jgi:predicted glycosyltransferase